MGRLSGLAKILLLKGSLITSFFLGGYITYENMREVKQIEHNLFDKNQSIEKDFFADPPSLEIGKESNKKGNLETYLVYQSENGVEKKIEILFDMFPKTETMLKCIKVRYEEGYNEKRSAGQYIDLILDLAKGELKNAEEMSNEKLEKIADRLYGLYKISSGEIYGAKIEPHEIPSEKEELKMDIEKNGVTGINRTTREYIDLAKGALLNEVELYNQGKDTNIDIRKDSTGSFDFFLQYKGPSGSEEIRLQEVGNMKFADDLTKEYSQKLYNMMNAIFNGG